VHIVIDARLSGVAQRGIGRYSEEMLFALDEHKEASQTTAFVGWDVLPELQKKIKHIRLLGVSGRWYSFWAEQIRFAFLVLKERPSIVLFFHWNVPLLLALSLSLAGIPWVVTIHDLILLHHGPDRASTTLAYPIYWLKFQALRVLLSVVLRLATRIIVVSQATMKSVREFFPHTYDRIVVIGEGSEHVLRLLPVIKKEQSRLRQISTPIPYILYVGSTYPYKNVRMLIETFHECEAELRSRGFADCLIIVGVPDQFQARLRTSIAQEFPSSRVFFVQANNDEALISWYINARVLVLPSQQEGFGLPALEAMACGTALAVSNIAALKELAGEAALYFAPDDRSGLKQAIFAVGSERRLAIGQQRASTMLWSSTAQYLRALLATIFDSKKIPIVPMFRRPIERLMRIMSVAVILITALLLPKGPVLGVYLLALGAAGAMTYRLNGAVLCWSAVLSTVLGLVFIASAVVTFFSLPAIMVYSVMLPLFWLVIDLWLKVLPGSRVFSGIESFLIALGIWELSVASLWIPIGLMARASLVLLCSVFVYGRVFFPQIFERKVALALLLSVLLLLFTGYSLR